MQQMQQAHVGYPQGFYQPHPAAFAQMAHPAYGFIPYPSQAHAAAMAARYHPQAVQAAQAQVQAGNVAAPYGFSAPFHPGFGYVHPQMYGYAMPQMIPQQSQAHAKSPNGAQQ
jgi:hypothetical protein